MPDADTIIAGGSIAIITVQLMCIAALMHYHRRLNHMNTILLALAATQGAEAVDFFLPTTLPPKEIMTPSNAYPLWRTVIIIASFVLSLTNMLIILAEKLHQWFYMWH